MNQINGIKTDFRFAGIDKFDFNNGNGVGATLFMQGCSHHCKECQNKSTWDKHAGEEFTQKNFDYLFDILANDVISRLTLSGGDPLDNVEFTYFISREFKKKFPQKELWIYTGYTYEYISTKKEMIKILKLCDILVDGEFIVEKKNLRLKFRGSENQRIIDVQKSIKEEKIILWTDKEF